jgi:hypothetical protein
MVKNILDGVSFIEPQVGLPVPDGMCKTEESIIDPELVCSSEVSVARSLLCSTCESRTYDRCSKCGCEIRFLTILNYKKCPIGRWL